MNGRALRFGPGVDLKAALEALALPAGFVVSGIGSLDPVALRYAGRAEASTLAGPHEIVALAGSVSPDGAHLHMSVADGDGTVRGGHVARGCIVRTTAEVLVAELPGITFAREHDTATGYRELVITSAGERT